MMEVEAMMLLKDEGGVYLATFLCGCEVECDAANLKDIPMLLRQAATHPCPHCSMEGHKAFRIFFPNGLLSNPEPTTFFADEEPTEDLPEPR